MTFLAALVFPVIAILCGIAVMVSLTRFIAEIRRDARRDD